MNEYNGNWRSLDTSAIGNTPTGDREYEVHDLDYLILLNVTLIQEKQEKSMVYKNQLFILAENSGANICLSVLVIYNDNRYTSGRCYFTYYGSLGRTGKCVMNA